METDIEVIKSNFRQEASQIFSYIFRSFRKHAEKLDRQRDENVFQQLAGSHADQLKTQLTQTAKKMMARFSGPVDKLNRELTKEISYYISEFHVKIMSM